MTTWRQELKFIISLKKIWKWKEEDSSKSRNEKKSFKKQGVSWLTNKQLLQKLVNRTIIRISSLDHKKARVEYHREENCNWNFFLGP